MHADEPNSCSGISSRVHYIVPTDADGDYEQHVLLVAKPRTVPHSVVLLTCHLVSFTSEAEPQVAADMA